MGYDAVRKARIDSKCELKHITRPMVVGGNALQ